MASPPVAVVTTGSSMSRGRLPRASLTLAMTSDNTSLLFSPSLTCTSISERLGSLLEVMYSMPRAPAILICKGVVTKPCMVRALAPR